ncbi:hypothetical protein [Luteolibacter soli]|uniref:Uncharacterized protein n=1 Tax=Luteolibacter soli TaxID=3135280 RepID=A0ABU9AUY0_9BACT
MNATRPGFTRLLSFWLGLPLLLFLFWAWWDSTRFLSLIECQRPSDKFEFSSFMGRIQVGHYPTDPYGSTKWDFDHMPLSKLRFDRDMEAAFPRYLTLRANSLAIAHWFLISLYAAAWLGSSFLWHRRKLRLMTAASAPPP